MKALGTIIEVATNTVYLTCHTPEKSCCICNKPSTSKPRNNVDFRAPAEVRETETETEVDAGKLETDGERAKPGAAGFKTFSGFGGLGLEGIVGSSEERVGDGDGAIPLGVGHEG